MTRDAQATTLLCYPMHGLHKLHKEGYRTRDGHLIEWFSRLSESSPLVISRPEPILLTGFKTPPTLPGTRSVSPVTWKLPNPTSRRKWWVQSAKYYPEITDPTSSAVVWNPFTSTAQAQANPFKVAKRTVFDLLDDWSIHYAFSSIKNEVESAYASAFEAASLVTCNSEGTLALAHRFGREDAILIPNGVDPDRYSTTPNGINMFTVGYIGKIGKRLDLELILRAANENPEVHFIFAGPILDREYREPLAAVPNIELMGDVHYRDTPALMQRFSIGWVPHRVGAGEVGGDVIKTYEYRASGLPVLTTPIAFANSRGLSEVNVVDREFQSEWIATRSRNESPLLRVEEAFSNDLTWKHKAKQMLGFLNEG